MTEVNLIVVACENCFSIYETQIHRLVNNNSDCAQKQFKEMTAKCPKCNHRQSLNIEEE